MEGRKTATGIPLGEFAKAWNANFDQTTLEVKGEDLYSITMTGTGQDARKIKESTMLLGVIGAALGLTINDLFVRGGIVWCME